jgi:predicted small secreted protein
MIRRCLVVMALTFVIFSLMGCQTVQGLGRDITTAGEAGERALEKP